MINRLTTLATFDIPLCCPQIPIEYAHLYQRYSQKDIIIGYNLCCYPQKTISCYRPGLIRGK